MMNSIGSRKWRRVLLFTAALALVGPGLALAAPLYTLTDLGPPDPVYQDYQLGIDPNGVFTHIYSGTFHSGNFAVSSQVTGDYDGQDGTPPPGLPVGVPYAGGTLTYYGTNGTATNLLAAPEGAGQSVVAFGLNLSGTVVGDLWKYSPEVTQAFLYTPARGVQLLPTLNQSNGVAYAINDLGQIVGQSPITGNLQPVHAFLSNGLTAVDLNTLIPPGSGLTLIDAEGINDKGLIVGQAVDASGHAYDYLLTPIPSAVPEPSVSALAALVAAGFAVRSLACGV